MARRIASLADLTAISNLYLQNRPDLAAMVASGGYLPVEHIRRKLVDPDVVVAYDTVGGIVGLRHLPSEDAVLFEIGGFAALSATARRALWALAKDTWKARLSAGTRLMISCREGDAIDTFLASRVPQLRTVQSTIGTPNEMSGAQPVLYETTLGTAL